MSSNNNDHKAPVVIKRVKKVHGGHHGGSWKIAYADFVTAMMAFFLLMWLLSLLNKYQLEGIAQYFKKPLKEAFTKQDNIAKTNAMKPDKLGPTTYKESGSKEKTENAVDKNLGKQDKSQPDQGMVNDKKKDTISQPEMRKKTSDVVDESKTIEQQQQIQQMKIDLENKLKSDPQISQFKNQLNFIVTSDGLKIVLNELQNKPMFSEGKTDFEKYAKNIITWLSNQINVYPNQVVIIGHTDTVPYPQGSANYSNWELSADRANSARRLLIQGGMDQKKILRIIGGADADLLDKQKGDNPSNRRIEIIILTDQAAKHMQDL